MTSEATWQVRVGVDATTAIWDRVDDPAPLVVLAPGAGGHMHDRSMLAISQALRRRGIGVVRFNFFYRERGSSRPDAMPRLIDCYRAVVERVQADVAPSTLVIGGRSMGGRVASVMASTDSDCQGLLLLAYPLHPPGRTDKLRAAHLPSIRIPVLCISGTRDTFCERRLMEAAITGLQRTWQMHWLDDADHGFHVRKRSGRTDTEALDEAADAVAAWMSGLGERAGRYSSEDVHRLLFAKPPKEKVLEELKEGLRGHVRARHPRR